MLSQDNNTLTLYPTRTCPTFNPEKSTPGQKPDITPCESNSQAAYGPISRPPLLKSRPRRLVQNPVDIRRPQTENFPHEQIRKTPSGGFQTVPPYSVLQNSPAQNQEPATKHPPKTHVRRWCPRPFGPRKVR